VPLAPDVFKGITFAVAPKLFLGQSSANRINTFDPALPVVGRKIYKVSH
jgi:hypothetical protein